MKFLILNLHLPPNFKHDHFRLTVKIESDAEEIERQTEILSESTDTLEAAVDKNQPSPP